MRDNNKRMEAKIILGIGLKIQTYLTSDDLSADVIVFVMVMLHWRLYDYIQYHLISNPKWK